MGNGEWAVEVNEKRSSSSLRPPLPTAHSPLPSAPTCTDVTVVGFVPDWLILEERIESMDGRSD